MRISPEPNHLRSRDPRTIEEIERSFSAGHLREAVEASPAVERRVDLSPAEFECEYRGKGRPVVMQGMLDHWHSVKEWTFEFLADKCGDTVVVVNSYTRKRAQKVTFRDFFAMLSASQAPDHQPLYLQEWLFMVDCPFLAADTPELEIAQYDFRRNLYGEKISTNHQLWIGQKGASTTVHQDSYMIDVMHAQIVGAKRWSIMAPPAWLGTDEGGALNFETLAQSVEAQIMHCDLGPGEVLYLPALWWHRIELLSDSIGLGRKCLDEKNLQEHVRLRLAELLPLALNNEGVNQAYPELYQVVMMRNLAWAKLLEIDLDRLRPA